MDIIICPFLDYYILSIFHYLGSPLSYHTLNFELMSSRNIYLYNAYIYSILITWANKRCCVDRTVPEAIHNQVAIKLLKSGLLT